MFNTEKYSDSITGIVINERSSLSTSFNGAYVVSSGIKTDSLKTDNIKGTSYRVYNDVSINDGIFPYINEELPSPISIDLVYDKINNQIIIMNSENVDLLLSTVYLGRNIFPYCISSTAVIINCGEDTGLRQRDSFSPIEEYRVLNNTSNEALYPFLISLSTKEIIGEQDEILKEWPLFTLVKDYSQNTDELCSSKRVVYNDSNLGINKIKQNRAYSIHVSLKEEIKSIIDSLFNISSSSLFKIILNPIISYYSTIKETVKVLFPLNGSINTDLPYIVFETTESLLEKSPIYKIIIKNENNLLLDISSTGEYIYGSLLNINSNIIPGVFYINSNNNIELLSNEFIKYEGAPNTIKDMKNKIILKLNESVVFNLIKFKNIKIEIYSNDGSRTVNGNL